jgi:hypothetical protein
MTMRPTSRRQRSTLAAPRSSVVAVVLAGVLAGPFGAVSTAHAADTGLQAAGTIWEFADDIGTSNGLPAGGTCTTATAGTGAGLTDAHLGISSRTYDNGAMLWVDGTPVGGTAVVNDPPTRAAFSPVAIGGLTRQVTYDALSHAPVLRVLLTLTNTTAAPITVPVDYALNHGLNPPLETVATSSGDTAFTPADRWIIVDEAPPHVGMPQAFQTSALYGPGNPVSPPTSVSQTVFDCFGTEGVRATFNASVPAGATRRLMFFERMGGSRTSAVEAAAAFDTITETSPLAVGLTPVELDEVVNWNLTPPSCAVVAVRRAPNSPSGRDEMDVRVRDSGGLQAITNIAISNGMVSVTPSTPFPPSTTQAIVTAVKTTQGVPTSWSFDVVDRVGKTRHCA